MTPSELFDAQKQQTLQALRDAVKADPEALFAPLNGFGSFGWAFEGSGPAAEVMQGDLFFGLAYLEHMINQGFETAFAVLDTPRPCKVCLKTWEPGSPEPAWPAQAWHLIYRHGQEEGYGI